MVNLIQQDLDFNKSLDSMQQEAHSSRLDIARPSPHEFPGPAYEPKYDEVRLKGQQARIYSWMKDGIWRTLREIHNLTRDPEASISAQLRVFRRPLCKGGLGLQVLKRRRGNPSVGCWEYKVVVNQK